MTTLVVIQARMGSTRLPGKVLADLGGRPLLGLQLARLERLPEAQIVVATSDLPGDDPVAALADEYGVPSVRGPEQDVLGRFALAVAAHPGDEVVRLTADCPLTDPGLVEAVLALRRATDADYAGNTLIRTFPDGLDVEVMTAATFATADRESTDPLDREHVTRFVLRNPHRFRSANLRASRPSRPNAGPLTPPTTSSGCGRSWPTSRTPSPRPGRDPRLCRYHHPTVRGPGADRRHRRPHPRPAPAGGLTR